MANEKAIEEVIQRIGDALKRSGPLTAQEIAEALDYPVRGIETILRQNPRMFEHKGDPLYRWCLNTKKANEYKPLNNGEGLLSYMGYHVGHSGQLRKQRRDILERVMESTLPKIISPEYIADWGEPRSQQRLRKLADSLAAFRSDRERKVKTSNDEAIRDWTDDLQYLKETYWDKSWEWRW